MRHAIIILVIIVVSFSGITAFAADSDKEEAALTAAEKWLALTDTQKYDDSWENAAELFKKAVRPKQWRKSMQAVREPLGEVISRKAVTIAYKTALPGAPDGEYVVIKFDTSFKNKKKAVETVTPMLDKDGIWRVSGYYIK